jgi:hypothetical protein
MSEQATELYAVADCTSQISILIEPGVKLKSPQLIPVCLIPMGLETPSVGPQIAECQKVLEKSGLEYKVHFISRSGRWMIADDLDAVSYLRTRKRKLTIKWLWNESRGTMG